MAEPGRVNATGKPEAKNRIIRKTKNPKKINSIFNLLLVLGKYGHYLKNMP